MTLMFFCSCMWFPSQHVLCTLPKQYTSCACPASAGRHSRSPPAQEEGAEQTLGQPASYLETLIHLIYGCTFAITWSSKSSDFSKIWKTSRSRYLGHSPSLHMNKPQIPWNSVCLEELCFYPASILSCSPSTTLHTWGDQGSNWNNLYKYWFIANSNVSICLGPLRTGFPSRPSFL